MRKLISLFVLFPLSLYAQQDYRTAFTTLSRGEAISTDTPDNTLNEVLKSKGKKVLYFVSTDNCHICMESVKSWVKFSSHYPGVKQLIIIPDASQKIADEIKSHNGLNVPVIADAKSRLTGIFKLISTPVFFILDTNNTVINYDKCGGNSITPDSLKKYLVGTLSVTLQKSFSLTLNNVDYEWGAPRAFDFVKKDKCYYIIDRTFQKVIKADSTGAVKGIIENKDEKARMVHPTNLAVPPYKTAEYDIAVCDYTNMGGFVFYFKFKPDKGRQLVKVKRILRDTEFTASDGFSILSNHRMIAPLSLIYTSWTDSGKIRQHQPLGEVKDSTADWLVVHPLNTAALDTAFLKCWYPKGAPEKTTVSKTDAQFELISDSSSAFFYHGLNKLIYLDKDLNFQREIEMKLDNFDRDDCRDDNFHSYVVRVFPFHANLAVVYMKANMTPESGYRERSNDYYIQLLTRNGNPLTRAFYMKDLSKLTVFPFVTMNDKSNICFVGRKEGKYLFSVYKIKVAD